MEIFLGVFWGLQLPFFLKNYFNIKITRLYLKIQYVAKNIEGCFYKENTFIFLGTKFGQIVLWMIATQQHYKIANLLGVKFGGKTHQIYTTKEKKSQNFPTFLWEK